MNLTEKVLQLTTIALGLKGKTIRLQGVELAIGMAMITNERPGGESPAMTLELLIPEDGPKPKDGCECEVCQTAQALSGGIAGLTSLLLTKGRAAKLVLDSCGSTEDGFTAKVRNTATRRCDVGEGCTMLIAVAHAAAKSARV